MKKVLLIALLVVMASAMMLAQTTPAQATLPTTKGAPGSVAPTIDVLGAHQNYGRGCAGCHSPHSGAKGEGGNALTGGATDPYSGVNALFGQDMGPLWGQTFDFSDVANAAVAGGNGSKNSYLLVTPGSGNPAAMTAQQYADMRGVVMCLACHDGVTAKGAMMQNWAYEQQIGALPGSYGKANIPTLIGIGGGVNAGLSTNGGDYNADHPVGESATISAVLGTFYNNATNGLTYTVAAGKITAQSMAGQYSQFVASYGAPVLLSGAHGYATPVNATNVPYVVCTTCHNQHAMNVYAVIGTGTPGNNIAGNATGFYQTYFFINGPYNPNTVNIPLGTAASTTQFCRQCHFGESNEANGGTLPTVF